MDGDSAGKKSLEIDVDVADATSVLASDLTDTQSSLTDNVATKEGSTDTVPPISSYQIKPTLQDK